MAEYNAKVDEKEDHDLAKLFPLMNEDEFNDLVDDIDKNGLLEAIVLYENKILDGRDRHRACKKLNIKPQFMEFKEWYRNIDPFDFIIAENLKRRHLTQAQKSEIGLILLKKEEKITKERKIEIATEIGRSTNKQKIDLLSKNNLSKKINEIKKQKGTGKSVDKVAKKMDLSPTTLSKAKKIKNVAKEDKEIDDMWNKALGGDISVNKVFKKVKEKEFKQKPSKEQREILDKNKINEFKKIASQVFLKLTLTNIEECNDKTKGQIELTVKKIVTFLQKEFNYLF